MPRRTLFNMVAYLCIVLIVVAGAASVLYYHLTNLRLQNHVVYEYFISAVVLLALGTIIFAVCYLYRFPNLLTGEDSSNVEETTNHIERFPSVGGLSIKTQDSDECGFRHVANANPERVEAEPKPTVGITQNLPAFEMNNEALGFVQIFGLIVFGLAGTSYSVLRIYDFAANKGCLLAGSMTVHCARMVFFIAQTVAILRFSRVRFLKHITIVRIGIGVVFAANLCIWFQASMSEISEGITDIAEIEERSKEKITTATDRSEELVCSNMITKRVSAFLVPAVIEYSMLATIIILDCGLHAGKRVPRKSLVVHHKHVVNKLMHRSRRGTLIGMGCIAGTVVIIIIIYVLERGASKQSTVIAIFLIQKFVLLSASYAIMVIVYVRTRDLRGSRESNTVDEVLLLLTVCGSYTFYVIMISSNVTDIMTDGKNTSHILSAVGFVVNGVMEIVQITFQTALIYELTTRCSDDTGDIHKKPGRSAIALLAGLNYALWLMATFEIKKEIMALSEGHHDVFGYGNASKIYFIVLPLLIFYRFHSSVFISALWDEIYNKE